MSRFTLSIQNQEGCFMRTLLSCSPSPLTAKEKKLGGIRVDLKALDEMAVVETVDEMVTIIIIGMRVTER